jgi:hypothetical protein
MKKDIEELIIYNQYMQLILYTEMITEKYPRIERLNIVARIKRVTYDGLSNLIYAYKVYDKSDKLKFLNMLDANLKMIKALIRVSRKRKYINGRNYAAWSTKLFNIGNLLGGWINSCVKQ